ncbi:MAG: FecR domain-containing protein [Bacteroidota bacterium]|nr:FecR domain-containing protein [Bacteroidota bacterium]
MNNYQPYFNLAELIAKYLRDELTVPEQKELELWLNASVHNQELFRKLTDETRINQQLEVFSVVEQDKAWEKIAGATGFKKTTITPFKLKQLFAYAAAVVLLLTVGVGLNRYFFKKTTNKPLALHKPDILPGTNKAVLTLANGSKIVLNDAGNGKIARQQNIVINKAQNGELIYNIDNSLKAARQPKVADLIAMNTLTTPRGGQYEVVLPDGTKVWLNAASSLKYPTSFPGNERKVELAGEAYFEVAKNAAKPFFVKTANQTVEVLGTHFNISSYSDETSTKTTLLEGSINVANASGMYLVKLKPGQQAISTIKGIKINTDADVEEAMAWKNGKFMFKNTDLPTIMRLLSRWYDVDVEYQGTIAEKHYRGRISRNVPVSQVFEILKTSGVNFTIIGRKIIVKP